MNPAELAGRRRDLQPGFLLVLIAGNLFLAENLDHFARLERHLLAMLANALGSRAHPSRGWLGRAADCVVLFGPFNELCRNPTERALGWPDRQPTRRFLAVDFHLCAAREPRRRVVAMAGPTDDLCTIR